MNIEINSKKILGLHLENNFLKQLGNIKVHRKISFLLKKIIPKGTSEIVTISFWVPYSLLNREGCLNRKHKSQSY